MLPCFARRAVPLFAPLMVWAVSTGFSQHIVAPGETLSEIAISFDADVRKLAEINHIRNPDLILTGQVLEIPEASGGETLAGATGAYVVQPGDTLGDIALLYGVTTDELRSLNRLDDPNLLSIGQQLVVPAGSAPEVSGPPTPREERPSSPKLEATIETLAQAEGIDPNVIKAISWVESRWEQGAVSSAGAVGVMQLQPSTTSWLEADVFHHDLNESESVYDNVKGGVRLFRILLDETGSEDTAIMAYYQGLGVTQRGTVYEETRRYLDAVKVVRGSFWP